jgi:hypothetical protein
MTVLFLNSWDDIAASCQRIRRETIAHDVELAARGPLKTSLRFRRRKPAPPSAYIKFIESAFHFQMNRTA